MQAQLPSESNCSASGRCSRSCRPRPKWRPTAMCRTPGPHKPYGWPGHGLQGKTWGACSYGLHSLKRWSLRETRCGSPSHPLDFSAFTFFESTIARSILSSASRLSLIDTSLTFIAFNPLISIRSALITSRISR